MIFQILFLTVLISGLAHAGTIADYQKWHEQCQNATDTATIDQIIERYQRCLDADPNDQLAKVYLGSAHTLRSAETFWGPKKLEYLKKGGALMDEAVDAAPNDPRVRFIRAVNAYKVPKHFKRRPVALSDFATLLPIAELGGHGLTKRERQVILFYAWKTFSEEAQLAKAAQAKQSCHTLDPTSWYGQETAK